GLRGEIGSRHHLAAIVARDLVEQAFELGDVAVDRLHEFTVGAVLAPDLLEGPLALHGVELAREDVALAAFVTVPQFGCGLVVDHAGDVDRDRVERLHRLALRPGRVRSLPARRLSRRRLARWWLGLLLRRAGEQIGEPPAAWTASALGRCRA